MDKPPDFGGLNPWDWAGAVLGTLASLLYSKPKTRSEFLTRLAVSFIVGGLCGFAIGELMGWPDTARHALLGGGIASFFAYALIGFGARMLEKADKLPK